MASVDAGSISFEWMIAFEWWRQKNSYSGSVSLNICFAVSGVEVYMMGILVRV